MSDNIHELERNIEENRGLLDRTLSQLTAAISPEQISNTVAREVQARSGAAGSAAIDMARANPAAAVLVGVGLAALLAGPKRPTPEVPYDRRDREVVQGQRPGEVLTGEFDRRVAAAEAAEKSEPFAPKMRAAINNGLAELPEPARRRVLQARRAAIDVQEKLDRQAAIAARKARSYHYRQPLSTGAIAVGLGALVAAMLPRTRLEDDMLGAKRDELLQQAEFTLKDEFSRATQTGEAALRESVRAGYDRLQQH